MFVKKDEKQESNFWISYADLMAGLLFVFILLIGAIVSKSIILKSYLQEKENKLEKVEKTLKIKEQKLLDISSNLSLKTELLKDKNSQIDSKDSELNREKQLLALRDAEIQKLNKMLLQSNTQKDRLDKKIVLIQNIITDTNLSLNRQNKKIEDYENRVIVLSNQITDIQNSVKLKDNKLLELLNALDEKDTKYNQIVENLQNQRAKIKNLTGIRVKVITALKKELGDKISLDSTNGSLRLSSNILFSSGSDKLKDMAKEALRKSFKDYITALLSNPNIKPHIDKIIIEGHTDSVGSYMSNLKLSQNRALAVMDYILTLDVVKKYKIKSLITASGRSYMDLIKVNGKEDREASRRIEIKFKLKNNEAMQEIERVLDAK